MSSQLRFRAGSFAYIRSQIVPVYRGALVLAYSILGQCIGVFRVVSGMILCLILCSKTVTHRMILN
jgi:hypothetical protein